MLKRLIVLPLIISLTACSTMSVENNGKTVTATVTRPVLFDSLEESVGKVSESTHEMLKGICERNQPSRKEEKSLGIAEAIVVAKNFTAVLGEIVKILPSLSYSATMSCSAR